MLTYPGDGGLNQPAGARVRAARLRAGVSLRELARRVGVSPATVSLLETGRVRAANDRIAQIAAALGVAYDDILTGPGLHPKKWVDHRIGRITQGGWRDYPPLNLDPILSAAMHCFVDVGYHAASVRQIARRAGLSVPGVYHHYSSKQEMLAALMKMTMDDLLRRSAAAAAEQQGPADRFSSLVECLVLFHAQRRDLAFIASSEMRSLNAVSRRKLQEARNVQQRMLDNEVVVGRDSGVFRVEYPIEAARAVGTMCTAVAGWFRPNGKHPAEAVAYQHVKFALKLVGFEV